MPESQSQEGFVLFLVLVLHLGLSPRAFAAEADPNCEDYFERLGLEHPVKPGDLRAAWVAAIKLHHPERGGTTEDAQRLNDAYHALKAAERAARAPAPDEAPTDDADVEAARRAAHVFALYFAQLRNTVLDQQAHYYALLVNERLSPLVTPDGVLTVVTLDAVAWTLENTVGRARESVIEALEEVLFPKLNSPGPAIIRRAIRAMPDRRGNVFESLVRAIASADNRAFVGEVFGAMAGSSLNFDQMNDLEKRLRGHAYFSRENQRALAPTLARGLVLEFKNLHPDARTRANVIDAARAHVRLTRMRVTAPLVNAWLKIKR